MGLSIVVQRGAGDKPGDTIVDSLISSVPVALSRGRAELDAQSSGFQNYSVTVVFRPGIRLGMLVTVHDQLQGASWKAKVTGVQHLMQNRRLSTTLQLFRPT